MATVKLSTLRANIATQVETVSGFTAAKQPINPFRMPASIGDKGYAIKLTADSLLDVSQRSRHQRDEGARVRVDAQITFTKKLKIDAQLAEMDEGYDDAEEVIQALYATGAWQNNIDVVFTRLEPTLSDSGEWAIFTLNFRIDMYLALS